MGKADAVLLWIERRAEEGRAESTQERHHNEKCPERERRVEPTLEGTPDAPGGFVHSVLAGTWVPKYEIHEERVF